MLFIYNYIKLWSFIYYKYHIYNPFTGHTDLIELPKFRRPKPLLELRTKKICYQLFFQLNLINLSNTLVAKIFSILSLVRLPVPSAVLKLLNLNNFFIAYVVKERSNLFKFKKSARYRQFGQRHRRFNVELINIRYKQRLLIEKARRNLYNFNYFGVSQFNSKYIVKIATIYSISKILFKLNYTLMHLLRSSKLIGNRQLVRRLICSGFIFINGIICTNLVHILKINDCVQLTLSTCNLFQLQLYNKSNNKLARQNLSRYNINYLRYFYINDDIPAFIEVDYSILTFLCIFNNINNLCIWNWSILRALNWNYFNFYYWYYLF